MKEVGPQPIMNKFLSVLRKKVGRPFYTRNPSSKTFMNHTFELIERGKTHEVAAFALAGIDRSLDVQENPRGFGGFQRPSTRFHYYLERHTHLDEEHHGPMALRLLENLCKDKPTVENEIVQQAIAIIEARFSFGMRFWACPRSKRRKWFRPKLSRFHGIRLCRGDHTNGLIFRSIGGRHPWFQTKVGALGWVHETKVTGSDLRSPTSKPAKSPLR